MTVLFNWLENSTQATHTSSVQVTLANSVTLSIVQAICGYTLNKYMWIYLEQIATVLNHTFF